MGYIKVDSGGDNTKTQTFMLGICGSTCKIVPPGFYSCLVMVKGP